MHLNGRVWVSARVGHERPDEPSPGKRSAKPKPSRAEEGRRIIEEYADSLREIIGKLRRRLNGGTAG
ncbi:hypothetical protein BSR47_01290 [Bradyrhizobium canariense]|nr:hypothetical protein BSR47_01290 [Bradyrhizobium canariense]